MATIAQKAAVNALFVGYFNRAADPQGLQFWLDAIDSGTTMTVIADAFAKEPEAAALYPFLVTPGVSTPASFINAIYLNLFNRATDEGGLKFWTDALTNNDTTAGQMITTIFEAALTTDKDILTNKVAAADHYTTEAGSTTGDNAFSTEAAKASLVGVTSDKATVDASKAATDATTIKAATAGATFTLKKNTATVTDALEGDSGDNIFDAFTGINTLENLDTIDGKGGIDTLNARVTGTVANAPVLTSIENINLTTLGSVSALNATNWETAAISVTGSASGSTAIINMLAGQDVTLNSINHGFTTDSLVETSADALKVTLAAGGDHGTLDVDGAGLNDFDLLTLVSAGTADTTNVVTLTALQNEGAGTAASPREKTTIEGVNSLTIDGAAAALTGASIVATALADGKIAKVDIVDTTAAAFNAGRLVDIDVLSFSAAGTATTVAMAAVTGLANGQVVQLNDDASAGLQLASATGASLTSAATLKLADANITGALTTGNAFSDIEAITINSGGAANTIGSAVLSTDVGSSLTVTGDQNLTIGQVSAGTSGGVINASAHTGRFIQTAAATTGIDTVSGGTKNDTLLATTNATTTLTIDGGKGDDIITVTGTVGHASVIQGGAGADNITGGLSTDVISGGAGNDTFTLATGGTVAQADSIGDLNQGGNATAVVDSIVFNGIGAATTEAIVVLTTAQQNTVTATANIGLAVASVFGVAGVDGNVTAFTFGGDNFIVVNGDGNAAYNAGDDLLVKVTGLSGTLDVGDFSFT